jgi:K(+)-stimulated pyrophosphate-energized sodium pump
MLALYKGLIVAGLLSAVGFYFVINWLVVAADTGIAPMNLFITTLIGLALTAAMVMITEYFTSTDYAPVRQIAESSTTGHGTNIITGLAVSMKSTAWPIIVIVAAIIFSFKLA